MATGTRSRRGEGYRLRTRLIDAASQILQGTGDADQLSIRAVVAAAGVTAPSLYRHFPDKGALVRAVLERHFEAFQHALDAAAAGETEPLSVLRAQGLAYIRYGLEHPGAYRVLFSATHTGPKSVSDEQPHPGDAALESLLAAVTRSLSSAAASDSQVLALQLWTTLHGAVDLRISKPELPWPPPEQVVDLALLPLRAAAGQADHPG